MANNPIRPQNPGIDHIELDGGRETYRFRPDRLNADALAFKPVCRFSYNGKQITAREVLDVSPTGLAIVPGDGTRLTPGSVVKDLKIYHCNNQVWNGQAEVVYRINGGLDRVGLHFTSGQLNMSSLKFRDKLVERRLVSSLYQVREYDRVLPADWRAGISVVRHLLESAKDIMDDMQRNESDSSLQQDTLRKRELCAMVYHKWWPVYRDQLIAMDSLSAQLPPTLVESAQAYAAKELMPLLQDCPMHSRAYNKPLGYAGDFKLMLLGNDVDLSATSLYGCLLQHTVQNFELGKAIVARCFTAGRKVSEVVSNKQGPSRIVSLACGPAIELKRFLEEHPPLQHPVELILVDQDREALESAHTSLSRAILKREDGHLVKLNCLHFAIGQIMAPADEDERKLVEDVLQDVDLIYSMGLFDYLRRGIAIRLLRSLFPLLLPDGQLYIGNLERVPDCSWAMEYAVHWHLIYRQEADMFDMADNLRQDVAERTVSRDLTGHCLFLNLRKPSATS
jgi:extracellular factor (EF) 3-hydroxypalmitic acid methyl ester biosynthesis protein